MTHQKLINNMKRIKIYKNKTFKKKTGILIPVNFDKNYPINPKRMIMLIKNAHSFFIAYLEKF